MFKYIGILLTGIVTSFYYFPFFFKAFPVQNTKNLLAAVGIVLIGLQMGKSRKSMLTKEWMQIFVYAFAVSLLGLFSVTINNTPDYTYAFYIRIMMIWLCAAFCVLYAIHNVHGKITVPLLANYLIAVCVFQCVMALLIDNNVPLKAFIDEYIEQGQDFLNMSNVNRLYGIGASLDVAGTRFAAVLIMIVFVLVNKYRHNTSYVSFYVLAFLLISIIGNMIARTTTIGMVVSITYLLAKSFKGDINPKIWKWILGLVLLVFPIVVYLYYNSIETRKLLSFAFEGFFALYEKGAWEVSSNERLLKAMVVFPDNIKTWLIGDGYFNNPLNTDPYFTGKITGGYYMGTDIGYLRFIFYFGLVGLLTFMAYFVTVTMACCKFFKDYQFMFWMLMLITLAFWIKVATDIFLVFALFLMMDFLNRCQIANSLNKK